MNTQLRFFLVLLGAGLVALTYTFPLWQQYIAILPGGNQSIFPGLSTELTESFLLLPEEQRNALLELTEENPDLALTIVISQLGRSNPVPEPLQALPEDLLGRVTIALGDFVPANPSLQAEGQLTIFELASGRKIVRIDDLNITNIPDMSIWLSASPQPANREELEQNGIQLSLGDLQGNIGSQNYDIAAEVDLSRYNSIVIYSEQVDLVVSFARFAVRL